MCFLNYFFIYIDCFSDALKKEKLAQLYSDSEAEKTFNKAREINRKHPIKKLFKETHLDLNDMMENIGKNTNLLFILDIFLIIL